MKSKYFTSVMALIAMLALGLLFLPTASLAADQMNIKVHSHTAPPPAAQGIGLQMFLDELNKRTNNKFNYQMFWSSSLAKPQGQLELIKRGTVEIMKTSTLYFPAQFLLGHLEYAFPFGPKDPVLLVKAMRQIHEEFPAKKEEYTKQNAIMLAYHACPYYDIISKKPVNSLEELKGLKVGMAGRWAGEWVKAAGIVPVIMAGGDSYMGLQSGVIDGFYLWLEFTYAMSLHEQAKYLIQTGFGSALGEDVVVNKDFFNKLDPETQKIMIEVGKDNELKYAQLLKERKEDIFKKYTDAGVKVMPLPEADQEKWAAQCPDTAAVWAQEAEAAGLPGWAIAKRYQEITAQLGYKWTRQWAVKKQQSGGADRGPSAANRRRH